MSFAKCLATSSPWGQKAPACAEWSVLTGGWPFGVGGWALRSTVECRRPVQLAALQGQSEATSWRLAGSTMRTVHSWDASEVGSRALDFVGFRPSAHTAFRAHLTSCSHCLSEKLHCEAACVPSPTPWPPMGHFLCECVHMCIEVTGQPQALFLWCSPSYFRL